MKRIITLPILMLCILQSVYSQQVYQEDFDGNTVSFTATPLHSWIPNTNYYLPGFTHAAVSKSYLGFVPNRIGDTTILQLAGAYNFSGYSYVRLQFSHICKVSPRDTTLIQFKRSWESNWTTIHSDWYGGEAENYAHQGFNAASYPQWRSDDSTIIPSQSWWKDEIFDMSNDWNNESSVQLRFVIIHGAVANTQASLGWLLENIMVTAAPYELFLPEAAFLPPLVKDTVYKTGPWAINAKVMSRTSADIQQPRVVYTASKNGVPFKTDSVLMTNISGDSLWTAHIEQFETGSEVSYSITGKDMNNNSSKIEAKYTINIPPSGTQTGFAAIELDARTIFTVPIGLRDNFTWTRQLYLGSELSPNNTGGTITKMAWHYASNNTWMYTKQSCYFKVVDDTVMTSNAYVDPLSDGAALVYQGNIGATASGWVEIDLSTEFFLPPGKNLMIYWNHQHGANLGSGYAWSIHSTGQNMTAYGGSLTSFSGAASGYNFATYRPDARFFIVGGPSLNHSAAISSIDITDTVAVVANVSTPLYVNLKNKGLDTLRSAVIYHIINNGTPIQTAYNSPFGLTWDMNDRVWLGDFQAKVNGKDTITVWVEYPNGMYDSTTFDDTLTKIIYGSSDYNMYFVEKVVDTVTITGPFAISAHVSTHSSQGGGNVVLEVNSTKDGQTTTLLLSMQYNSKRKLYVTEIPQIPFGTHVVYSITKTDYLGNVVSIVDSFYVKRETANQQTGNYKYIGSPASPYTIDNIPYNTQWEYGWSRVLVLASELNAGSLGCIINSIAYYPNSYNRGTMIRQSVYFKAVSETNITDADWIDPIAEGASPVFAGSVPPPPNNTWMNITLDTEFELPPNLNLMIWWLNESNGYSGLTTWKSENASANDMSAFAFDMTSLTGGNQGKGKTTSRPVMRFEVFNAASLDEDHSVALKTIESPSEKINTVGQPIPISVSLKNLGRNDLDSCLINWSLNGQLQAPTYIYRGRYNGKLWGDFSDTVTIGYYLPTEGEVADIIVWVSMPNNEIDNITNDDTLSIKTIACTHPLTGVYTIGSSPAADYRNMESVICALKQCGMSGKLTLRLEAEKHTESIDLSALNAIAGNTDTIEIVSLSGNASNTIIETDNFGIKLGAVSNVLVKDITINLLGAGYGIELGSGNNIEINNCYIYLDTAVAAGLSASNANTHIGIYKAQSVISNNVRIVNNFISGGYYGTMLYGGYPLVANVDWLYENNRHENAYMYGAVLRNGGFISISDNVFLPASNSAYTATDWWGLTVEESYAGVIANNRVNASRHPNLIHGSGIYLYANNSAYAMPPILVKNNEIIMNAKSDSLYGMNLYNTSADVYHNSIYINSDSLSKNCALRVESDKTVNVSNNNIVSAFGYVLSYTDSSTVSDYNNLYTGGTVLGNYAGNVCSNFSFWQEITGKDEHSVSLMPVFVDVNHSMELSSNFEDYLCPVFSNVSTDINGNQRLEFTTMGCHTFEPYSNNYIFFDFHQWNNVVFTGQIIPVNIYVRNMSANPINTLTFEWSLNEATPTPYTYTFAVPLVTVADTVITIGTFTVSPQDKVEVWLRSINGDINHAHKTSISARSQMEKLAEFVPPFVEDTIYNLTFDVNALIRVQPDALTRQPQLDITSIINETDTAYSSALMTLTDGIWHVTLPQQYYNSRVIYSLTVTDLTGNTVTITDSTCIKYTPFLKQDTVLIGTEARGGFNAWSNPYKVDYEYSWSRNYYMAYEIDKDKKEGGYIKSIAFYNDQAYGNSTSVRNVSFYLNAVTDSIVGDELYIDPVADGATLVWGPTTSNTYGKGWVTFELDTHFYLPPNMNLLVYCENRNGIFSNFTNAVWQYSEQNKYTSISDYYDLHFPSDITSPFRRKSFNRPNMQLEIYIPSDLYSGYNLAVASVVEPVNKEEELCTPYHIPVKVAVVNLGTDDIDFAEHNLQVGVEVTDPLGNVSFYANIISTGGIASGKTDTLEFIPILPLLDRGSYAIKVWINNAVDFIPYDDTLQSQFVSTKDDLPILTDFSNGIPPQFVSSIEAGDSKWEYFSDPSFAVQPDSGTAMIRFAGNAGTASRLSTRQLNLYQATNPFVEFWYYHDTNAAKNDYSYTDINIFVNGVVRNLDIIYLRDPGGKHGWTYYKYTLNQFTMSTECVLIQFESMNRYSGTSQYIDYIHISSEADAAVSEIIIMPTPEMCKLDQSRIGVVIRSIRTRAIVFEDSAALILDFNGTMYSVPLQGKTLEGFSSDTVWITPNPVFSVGNNTLMAYFNMPVDNAPGNDTAKRIIDVEPKLEVAIHNLSDPSTPTLAGLENPQKITIKNTGNIELSNIGLILKVNAPTATPPYSFTTKKVYTQPLAAGDVIDIIFDEAYIVPWAARYDVEVLAYLECDSANIRASDNVQEYVNMTDLYIVEVTRPVVGTKDNVGEAISVSLRIKNRNIGKIYNEGDAKVGIMIKDDNGSIRSTVA
ncbi:MAG: right-handed parallel beta-helix repeat-containing protein, partial [Bacteroidales bacterium]|nr:right-handed parallel beta-helix repeat-containing protein [Bacteroidales bacterium]